MRKIEGFQCENCKFVHGDEESAVLCEEGHRKRLEGAKIAGMSFTSAEGKYGHDIDFVKRVPKSIFVRFSETWGDFGEYTLHRYGPRGV